MAEIRDDNDAAIAVLLALANEETLGYPAVTIDGVEVEAVVTEISGDEVFAAGGIAESGGFTAVVPLTAFPDGPPEKHTEITARGMELYVLSVSRGTSHYTITAGDPVALQT